jgi:hypothetical protein
MTVTKNELILKHGGTYYLEAETHQHFTGGPGMSYQFVIDKETYKVLGVANAHGYYEKMITTE